MLKKLYCRVHALIFGQEGADSPSAGMWQERVRRAALRLCEGRKGSLLEVGCGEGFFLAAATQLQGVSDLAGVDHNTVHLRLAVGRLCGKHSARVQLLCARSDRLPFPDESFDTVVCINTFMNMKSEDAVESALAEMTRVCRREGRLIFEFRNSRNTIIWLRYKLAPYYDPAFSDSKMSLSTFNPGAISEIMRRLGIRTVRLVSTGILPSGFAPMMIVEAERCQ